MALDNVDEGFISICEVFALWPGSLQVMENAGGEAAVQGNKDSAIPMWKEQQL